MLNNIILFIQPIDEAVKMGKMYLNRLAIEEECASEILSVEKLGAKVDFADISFQLSIGAGLEKAALTISDNYDMHLIFAGDFESSMNYLKAQMSKNLRDYRIQTVKVSHIYMQRYRLLTKEEMEMFYDGKHKILSQILQQSVQDDLESFNNNCIHGRFKEEKNRSFFFQRLTNEEMELVEKKDKQFFKSWNAIHPTQPDVSDARMKMSESKSKYLYAQCLRQSFVINRSADDEISPSCCDIMLSKLKLCCTKSGDSATDFSIL